LIKERECRSFYLFHCVNVKKADDDDDDDEEEEELLVYDELFHDRGMTACCTLKNESDRQNEEAYISSLKMIDCLEIVISCRQYY
jgi:hypothetical protein